ncbi:hypothetical protein Trydic_g7988 [Trypoxylus dichotomus]
MATVKIPEQKVILCATDRQSTLGLDHYDKIYKIASDRDIRLQLWDTGEAAILVFALDNAASFHVLSQHLLDIVTYAENAKIFLCGNKLDLVNKVPQVSDADVDAFCEQCHNLISKTYKTSCKTGEGLEEMFSDIATQLVQSNRSKLELQSMETHGFKLSGNEEPMEDSCLC